MVSKEHSMLETYGLRIGQEIVSYRDMRGGYSTWLNKSCEVVGHGYLSVDDVSRVACKIADGEVFAVVSNGNLTRAFHEEVACARDDAACGLLRIFLIEQLMWVITSRRLVIVTQSGSKKPQSDNRADWDRAWRYAVEMSGPVPPRILAWKGLDPTIEVCTIGRPHALSLLNPTL